MCAHSSVKLLGKVQCDKKNFLKAEMNLFHTVIWHQDSGFQSKNVLKYFKYTIICKLYYYLNFTGFVCVHSSVKLSEKVINNIINLIKAEILCHTASHLSEHTLSQLKISNSVFKEF